MLTESKFVNLSGARICSDCECIYASCLFDVCKCDVFMCFDMCGVFVIIEYSCFLFRWDVVTFCFVIQMLDVSVQPVAMGNTVFCILCSFVIF